MNKTKMITTFLPSFIMLSIATVTFTDILDIKGLFVIGLLLIFPILFLGQGVACGFEKGNILVSLVASTVTFFVIIMVFLNSSDLMYIVLYLVVALFGFGISVFAKKNISKGK
jgi:hypothetical protein